LQPTDIRNPDYFHKVVDCQWACPAHTPVPEYIRLIAAWALPMPTWSTGSPMCSRAYSVAPATVPASRPAGAGASRKEQAAKPEPVAICRLKRVAADFKDDITHLLPKSPAQRTASASPASAPVRPR
jgi:formate dehydrogenase beta subunit